MITLEDFLKSIDFHITEGSEYLWQCFGPDSYQISSWNRNDNENTVCAVFDKKTKVVYTMEAWDYQNRRTYRWIHPEYVDAVKEEYSSRNLDFNVSIDDEKFIDIDVPEDILEKSKAISEGVPYDTRIQVTLNLDDREMLQLMTLAHNQDITLNRLVEKILQVAIDNHNSAK